MRVRTEDRKRGNDDNGTQKRKDAEKCCFAYIKYSRTKNNEKGDIN